MKTPLKCLIVGMVLGICLGHHHVFSQVSDGITVKGSVTAAEDGHTNFPLRADLVRNAVDLKSIYEGKSW